MPFLQGEAMRRMTSAGGDYRLTGVQGAGSRVGAWTQLQHSIESSG